MQEKFGSFGDDGNGGFDFDNGDDAQYSSDDEGWSDKLVNEIIEFVDQIEYTFGSISMPVRNHPDFVCPKVISIGKAYVSITDELCSRSNFHFR